MRRIGASLGKRVAARNVPTRGMGTADPAGTMAGGIDASSGADRIYAENASGLSGIARFR